MRTIIAGSRSMTNYHTVRKTMAELPWKPTVILSGTARGADKLGERWAEEHKVPVERFPAQWMKEGRYNPSAGRIRNLMMAEKADALVAFWDGWSNGTNHMIQLAKDMGLQVKVVEVGS